MFNQNDEVQVQLNASWYDAVIKEVQPTIYITDLDTPILYSVAYGAKPKYAADQTISRVMLRRHDTGIESVDGIRSRA